MKKPLLVLLIIFITLVFWHWDANAQLMCWAKWSKFQDCVYTSGINIVEQVSILQNGIIHKYNEWATDLKLYYQYQEQIDWVTNFLFTKSIIVWAPYEETYYKNISKIRTSISKIIWLWNAKMYSTALLKSRWSSELIKQDYYNEIRDESLCIPNDFDCVSQQKTIRNVLITMVWEITKTNNKLGSDLFNSFCDKFTKWYEQSLNKSKSCSKKWSCNDESRWYNIASENM